MNEALLADRTPVLPPAAVPSFAHLSTEMLSAVFDQSLDCIKLIAPSGRLEYMNRNGLCAMEIDDFAMVAGADWWSLWPAEAQGSIEAAVQRARAGENVRLEAFCPTAKGAPRWWDVSVSPLRGACGEVQGLISTSRDITDRVADRELRETTAAEMRHRLQNAYSLAGALVSSAARGNPALMAFASDVLERLSRLGAAQRLLLESGTDGGVSLRSLVERLIEPFGSAACTMTVADLPDIDLPEDDVRALALVFGELATNSNKYGAMGHGGAIRFAAEVVDGTLHFHWHERFSPERSAERVPDGDGSGHRLVSRALASRGGGMQISWLDQGLDILVTLPHRV